MSLEVLFVSLTLLAGTAGGSDPAAELAAQEPLHVVVATDPTFPPMEFLTEQNSLVGFDIDLMRAIAQKASLEIEFKMVSWDGIFEGLVSHEYDAIVSSVTILPSRQEHLGFSRPYINAGQSLATRASDGDVTSLGDLSGHPVGAQADTSGAQIAQDQPGVKVVLFDDIDELFRALVDGKVDGVVVDLPVVSQYVNNPKFQGALRLAAGPLNTEEYGIVFARENRALLDRVNRALDLLKADGELDRLLAKWSLKPRN